MSVATSLKGIISQRLLERADRDGRVPAMEVLVNDRSRLRQDRRRRAQTHEIEEIIADGEFYGMQTFDQSLLQPLRAGRRDPARRARRRRRTRTTSASRSTTSTSAAPSRTSRASPPPDPRASLRSRPAGGSAEPEWRDERRSAAAAAAPRARVPGAEGRGCAHRARATSATWSAGRCGTRCSGVTATADEDVDFATDARPEAIEALLRPIGRGVVLVGARFGTVSAMRRRRAVRGHDVPLGRVPPGEPQARGRRSATTSRPTSRGATSPSTRWRCASPIPSSSTRSTVPSTCWSAGCARRSRRTSRSPTIRSACCARRASSPASGSSRSPS